MKIKPYIWSMLFLGMLAGCQDDEGPRLEPVEERRENAVQGVIDKLTAPANGWRLFYQPSPTSGQFLMLLDFEDNGDVRIRTDVGANGGEFRDQTSTYRVDIGLDLELIFGPMVCFTTSSSLVRPLSAGSLNSYSLRSEVRICFSPVRQTLASLR